MPEKSKKKHVESKKDYLLNKFPILKKIHINWKWTAIVLGILLVCDIVLTTQEPRFHIRDIQNLFVTKEMISDNVVFLGDSITYQYPLDEFYEDMHVVNSGVNGNQTTDILNNMYERVYRYNPSKVILLIGTNDLTNNRSDEEILDNIRKIIVQIKENRPYAKIYIQSIYPISETMQKEADILKDHKTNKRISEVNKKLKDICKEEKVTYIDTYSALLDENKELKRSYAEDGLHLTALGYIKVTNVLMPYINDEVE